MIEDYSSKGKVAMEEFNDETESFDTRVNKLIGSCQISDSAEYLTTIVRDFALNKATSAEVNENLADCIILAAKEDG